MGTLARSLKLQIKVIENTHAFDGIACVSLAGVCSVVKICRIMVKIIWACLLSSCLMPLVSDTKVNLSQPLPPSLSIYNQGNHSVAERNQSVFFTVSQFEYNLKLMPSN